MTNSWLEELETRLEQQLEAFLQANPQQEGLLAEQEARDRQERLRRERLRLRQEAELQRQALLELAGEIRQWQGRVERASAAGAGDLAERAQAHVQSLMDRGRDRWRTLTDLGTRFAEVQTQLDDLARNKHGAAAPAAAPPSSGKKGEPGDTMGLEADWAAFEAQQELQELRRRMKL